MDPDGVPCKTDQAASPEKGFFFSLPFIAPRSLASYLFLLSPLWRVYHRMLAYSSLWSRQFESHRIVGSLPQPSIALRLISAWSCASLVLVRSRGSASRLGANPSQLNTTPAPFQIITNWTF